MNVLILLFVFAFITQCHANTRDGLVGWWKFDEASGNAIDSSGQGHTGTPSGTTIEANCKRSGCRSFNGISDIVTTNFIPSNVFSLSVWFTSNVVGGNQNRGIASTVSFGPFNGFYISSADSNFGNCTAGGNDLAIITDGNACHDSGIPLTVGSWYHLVLTSDGTTVKVYTNGALGNSWLATTTHQVAIDIGDSHFNQRYWNGLIDDVRIYNRALTATDINALYVSGVSIKNGKLRGKFNF